MVPREFSDITTAITPMTFEAVVRWKPGPRPGHSRRDPSFDSPSRFVVVWLRNDTSTSVPDRLRYGRRESSHRAGTGDPHRPHWSRVARRQPPGPVAAGEERPSRGDLRHRRSNTRPRSDPGSAG